MADYCKEVAYKKAVEDFVQKRCRKCPRCGRPIMLPRNIFCCVKCELEDIDECDAEHAAKYEQG